MKIKIMTAEAVAYVKNNIDSLVSYYENKEDPTVWIKQKIGKDTLSRLWWLGRKTYRAESGEPWKIFDYFIHDINGYSFTLFGSNWSNSSRSLDLFFKAIFEYTEEYGRKVDRALFNEAMQYTNCLCGIYVLDACDDAFVVEEIKNYLVQRYDEMVRELADNKLNNVRTTGIEKFDNLIKAINYIGGHGKKVDIFNAYEAVTQTRNSTAIRMYIENQLQANCPDVRKYSGKPIFYKVVIEGGAYWKLANDYLIKANVPVRRELMMNQIETLSDVEKWVFNFITAIRKDKFTLDDLLQFSGQFGSLHPEVEDSERVMKDALIKMREKGNIVFIPRPYEEEEYIDDKDAQEKPLYFLKQILALDEKLNSRSQYSELPNWAKNIMLFDEKKYVEKNEAIDKKIEKLIEEKNKNSKVLNEISEYKHLLTGTGSSLENIVRKVLLELDFQLEEVEANRTDIIGKYKEVSVVFEIKGLTKSAGERNAAQLEKWISEYHVETGIKPKGVLLVNAFRNKPLREN